MPSTTSKSDLVCGLAAMALALGSGSPLLAQATDPAALGQLLDQLSEDELAALLLKVKRQKAAAATPARPTYPRPMTPAYPRPAAPARPSAAQRLANLRLEVAARDTTAAILQSLGPAGAEDRVARIVGDLVTSAYRRTGPFSHSPRRGMTLSTGEAKLLAGKIRYEVEAVMGAGAPFSLSPQARKVFESQILAAAPGEPEAMQAQVRAATEAKLAPSSAPPRPVSRDEIEAIDATFHRLIVRERKIDNHSTQVLKQWAQEESRRRRRVLLELGPVAARAWLRKNR